MEGVSLPEKLQLKLIESKPFKSGCVPLRYLNSERKSATEAIFRWSVDEVPNIHLPRVVGTGNGSSGSCAVESGIGRRAPVPQRRGLSAVLSVAGSK